ncbi:MAG: ATP-dependent DNA ligase, partial [Mycobacterium sp.]|nr:ATP-dependent DNA ligase [Mycobacterium sp.]
MLLNDIAMASAAVGGESARSAKIARIAALLATAADDRPTLRIVVDWLSGDLPQRQIGVGWASLRSLPAPVADATLTVVDVDVRLSAIKAVAGRGSTAKRTELLHELFGATTDTEQTFLRRLLSGGLRQGALAGVMADAVARAAGVPAADVRRAAMLGGSLAEVAATAVAEGADGLGRFALTVGRPVGPMLAQTATSVDDAIEKLGGTAIFETKLDGVRLQIHRAGTAVSIYTRSLDDVTSRLPDVVDAVLALPVTDLIADAEAVAMRPDGRPHRFQVTASRIGKRSGDAAQPLSVFFFDILHRDGTDLLDQPATQRLAVLDGIVPAELRVQRTITADPLVAQHFLGATLTAGHEGVMAKSPAAPYEAGRRGAGWLKIKPVHTLDLVVLADAWGSG